MLFVRSQQRALNRSTAGAAELFRRHRACLTRHALAAAAASGAREAAIFGAGNCNDLELESLLGQVERVHLVDLDFEATAGARRRLSPALRKRVDVHRAQDVTGAMARLHRFRTRQLSEADLVDIATSCVDAVLTRLPVRAGLVISPCLLSQLMDSAQRELGSTHPDLGKVARALLLGHLRLLLGTLLPGGQAVMASDVASSEDAPIAELVARAGAMETLKVVLERGICFTGADPRWAVEALHEEVGLSQRARDVLMTEPWLWDISHTRSYLVYALVFGRSGE